MPIPRIADRVPKDVNLKPGTYYWCTCGKSEKQPFCDGTHKVEMEFKSLKFEIEEETSCFLCQCKHTSTPPYCDGSHHNL